MAELVTRATLKTLWGIDSGDTSQDAAIDILILQCSARIEEYCGRTFLQGNYTEIYQGTGDKYLPIKQRPINSVASCYEDDSANWGGPNDFAAATLLVQDVDYTFVKDTNATSSRCGMLYRINGVWTKFDVFRPGTITPLTYPMSGNIRVTYNAGFATIPYDIQSAAAVLIAQMKRIIRIGMPMASETWEQYSYAVANAAQTVMGALPPDTAAILGRYRNQSIG